MEIEMKHKILVCLLAAAAPTAAFASNSGVAFTNPGNGKHHWERCYNDGAGGLVGPNAWIYIHVPCFSASADM
jgi:hypothetical protein